MLKVTGEPSGVSRRMVPSGGSRRSARRSLAISSLLLAWFARHARPLPWRSTKDPFAIWISEVMLQQTQVATVIPYYQRFLLAFPNVKSLAQADESAVLRLWEGLGYYRRARSLHQAARKMLTEHDGNVPNDPETLSHFPGLGRYTVNAILSQAFDRRLPILEANSRRVLCRLLGIEEDPSQAKVARKLWDAAEKLLPRKNAGRFNQALMELGALVCTARQPDCRRCPLARDCIARRLGLQETIPYRAARPRIEQVDEVALVIRKRHDVLLVQRPSSGRWAGLWEFPHAALTENESHVQAAEKVLQKLGLKAEIHSELLTIRHSVTRFRITLVCLEARHRGGKVRSEMFPQSRWVAPEKLLDYPFSSPQRRLARTLASRAP